MIRKLGKRPARLGAVSFAFGTYFDAAKLPAPPAMFGHYGTGQGLAFEELGNDRYGDCVIAGGMNETMVWGHEGGNPVTFTEANALADYTAITGFNPADPASDAGTDMSDAAAYRRKTGLIDAKGVRHTIKAYVALRPGDVSQLLLATYLFGATGVGLRLPVTAEDQFDAGRPWTYNAADGYEGGHYVPVLGKSSAGDLLVVTWGRLHAMSPAYYEAYSDEALCYLSDEMLRSDKLSPEGFSADQLDADLAQLGS